MSHSGPSSWTIGNRVGGKERSSLPKLLTPLEELLGERYQFLPPDFNRSVDDSVRSVSSPPAPRLVGIEPNPGPPQKGARKDVITQGLAKIGAALGKTIAKGSKRSKRTKQKLHNTLAINRQNSMISVAPVSFGTSMSSAPVKSKINSLTGTAWCFDIGCDATNKLVLWNGIGLLTCTAANPNGIMLNISGVGSGATALNWGMFGSSLLNILTNYVYYRAKKLTLRYVPTCPSTTAGAIHLATIGEASANSHVVSWNDACTMPCQMYTSVYQPSSVDAMKGFSNEWKFVENNGTTTQSAFRQENLGSLIVNANNLSAPLTGDPIQYYGSVYADYEFEACEIARQYAVYLPQESELISNTNCDKYGRPLVQATSSSSSSSGTEHSVGVPPPVPLEKESSCGSPPENLESSLYIPSTVLSQLLKR